MPRSAILLVLVVYWFAALASTHWPKPVASRLMDLGVDKIVHFVMYAILATLLFIAWPAKGAEKNGPGLQLTRRFLAIWLIVAAYGVIDELTQPWFNRQCDLKDWLADIAGAGAALLVCAWLARWFRRQSSQ